MAAPLHPYAKERTIAETAVLHAAALTKKVLSSVAELSKDDSSPVTIADFAAQALLIRCLHAAFPSDRFVGEEDSSVLKGDETLRKKVFELVNSSEEGQIENVDEMMRLIDLGGRGEGGKQGRFWVMDPVDGTATFLKGQQYAVSLALVEDGREAVGVLCCPNLKLKDGRVEETSVDTQGLGVMMTAVKGQGTTIRHLKDATSLPPAEPLPHLTSPSNLKDVHFIDSLESKTSRHDVVRQLADKMGAKYPGTDVWSSHVRYAAMILGGGHVHMRVPVSKTAKTYIWDHAGAQLIFSELGGKITDLDGKEMDFAAGRELSNNRGMIIARGDIYDKISSMFKEITWT